MKTLTLLALCIMVSGCPMRYQSNKTVKTERVLEIFGEGEKRPAFQDLDNQSQGNVTDKTLRIWKKYVGWGAKK